MDVTLRQSGLAEAHVDQGDARLTEGWDGYLDWAAQLGGARGSARVGRSPRLIAQGIDAEEDEQFLWEPIFVRSHDADIDTEDFFAALQAKDGEEPAIIFDLFEKDYNNLLRRAGEPVEAFVFRRRDRGQNFDNLFKVLTTGGLVTERGLTAARLEVSPRPMSRDGRVALGVIDDGIPVLHGRFRRDPRSTRVVAFWAQVLSGVGSVESQADLDQELARLDRTSEDDLYRERAAALYGSTTRHSLRQRGTHGGHMLDLAGGCDPADPDELAEVPLLAVQLPPQVFDDTSGMRLIPYLGMGLRWQIYQTIVHDIAPVLVVNASLGVVAGPKDGTSFIEQLIAREIDRAATNPVRPLDVKVVLPYGNAYADSLVARKPLAAGGEAAFPLRLQPADRTPSYVELRLSRLGTETDPTNLEVGLTGPQHVPPVALQSIPSGHHVPVFDAQGDLIAAIYHVPSRQLWDPEPEPAFLIVAFAPTLASFPGEVACPSGLWTISVRNAAAGPMDCIAQSQRDDSPFPRRTGARQAYLDRPPGEMLHEGTNSAYSTVDSTGAYAVGGALVRKGAPCEPAEYSAEGADWSGTRPDLSAISEEGHCHAGVRAAGMLSAATIRLSGSSAAAATLSRQLVLEALGAPLLPTVPVQPPTSRLGTQVVTDNPAIRR